MLLRFIFLSIAIHSFSVAQSIDLDMTFGIGGKVTTDFDSGSYDSARSIVIQDDGKIVVAGQSQDGGDSLFALARYNSDGSLDMSFGDNIFNYYAGKTTTKFSGRDHAYSVAVQNDGKIIVVGESYNSQAQSCFAIARYNYDGKLDYSFGGDGKVTLQFMQDTNDFARDVAVQKNDGKIVVAGWSYYDYQDFALARFDSNGSLDATFGVGGLMLTDFDGFNDVATSVAIQDDGKIVVAGYSWNSSQFTYFTLARYDSNGRLDATFGTGGKVKTLLYQCQNAFTNSVIIKDDGKIVVAGYCHNEPDSVHKDNFALAQYNSDGSEDWEKVVFTSEVIDQAYGVAVRSDNKIVIAGSSNYGGKNNFALAQFYNNGSLDINFGPTNWRVVTDFFDHNDEAYDIAIQSDGKIIVVGQSSNDNGDLNFALARYGPWTPVLVPIYYLLQ